MAPFPDRLEPGVPFPLGATWDGLGTNFAVFSGNATRIDLCIFDPAGRREVARYTLPEYTDEIWHGYLPGSRAGIIYVQTVADALQVSEWLHQQDIEAPAYFGSLQSDARHDIETRLLENRLDAVVATSALGMGFDKPDLGFVVHYQRPGSVVAYYQQVGRAGRAIPDAHAVLLYGHGDDAIQE